MTTSIVVASFPREDEVTITLRVRTGSQDDYDYFFLKDGEIQPGFLADLFDMLDMINQHIITINGKSQNEYHKILHNNSIGAL